jgi:hypothetical protein
MNTISTAASEPKSFLRNIVLDLPGSFPIARWAPIPLRLIVGFGFMEHGFAKLSKGPETFAGILQALAVPAPGLRVRPVVSCVSCRARVGWFRPDGDRRLREEEKIGSD